MLPTKQALLLCLGLTFGTAWSQDFLADRVSTQMHAIFQDPAFARAFWGIKILSLDNGEVLYAHNAGKLLTPASNMKLVTAIGALQELGADHRLQTRLLTFGKIERGTLKGDLIVQGGGDPTIGSRFTRSETDWEGFSEGDPWKDFEVWVHRLKELGVRRIQGNLIGDDLLFAPEPWGEGWNWDDLSYGYAAEIGALQFNENVLQVRLRPASQVGAPAQLEVKPELEWITVLNRVDTGPAEEDLELQIERSGNGRRFVLRGVIPVKNPPVVQRLAIRNATEHFLLCLRKALEKSGIKIEGNCFPIGTYDISSENRPKVLFEHVSPPLKEILRAMLKVSQNLYAETLIRLLDRKEEGKTFAGGRKTIEKILERAGIPEQAWVMADGSGLSRYNLLTPESLVRLLEFAFRSEDRDLFIDLLPLGGVDGTIENRMHGTGGENNVRAKTGTVRYTRSLSGYVRTQDGEFLAFAMLVNHYLQPRQVAEYLQDETLHLLSNLSRRSAPQVSH